MAWPLAERWMSRQTIQPNQWIVADDGLTPAPLTMGQEHIRRTRTFQGGGSLALNLLAAIPRVRGDFVLVFEDDDYYRPNHIETCVRRLEQYRATGCIWMDYYNVQYRSWRRLRNSCAALCNTAFRAECLPMLKQAAEDALRRDIYHVDRLFWQQAGNAGLHEQETVIVIKGLPGRVGIGIGHRPGPGWVKDGGRKLREWIGADATNYLQPKGVMP